VKEEIDSKEEKGDSKGRKIYYGMI